MYTGHSLFQIYATGPKFSFPSSKQMKVNDAWTC